MNKGDHPWGGEWAWWLWIEDGALFFTLAEGLLHSSYWHQRQTVRFKASA